MTRIAMVAAEASSDQLAAHLIRALRVQLPHARFVGIGGPRMEAEGFDAWWSMDILSVRGYAEALRSYRKIAALRRRLVARLLDEPPAMYIGIDGSDFNLGVEKRLRARGVPTVQFVSPSIWAWRGGRIRRIEAAVDHVLALYPFEPALYEKTRTRCTFVGHPMADVIPLHGDKAAMRETLGIPAKAQVVALLPGSRRSELEHLAPVFIETAKRLLQRFPGVRFLVPLASRETRAQFEQSRWELDADELPMTLMFGHAQQAMTAADVVLVASGTATLETALVGRPMVIAYRMSKMSWRIMRGMGYLPWVGLPNILAGRFVVPEFLQDDATPENLAQAVGNLLVDRPAAEAMAQVFEGIHRQLRQDTASKAAQALLPYLGRA